MNLIERIRAVQPFVKEWLLAEYSFEERNCGLMAAGALRSLGYKVPKIIGVTVAPANPRKVMQFLKKHGGIEDLMAKYATRVFPLAAAPGDILVYPSDDNFPALGVALGNGEAMIVYPVDETGKKVILAGRAVEGAVSAWSFV